MRNIVATIEEQQYIQGAEHSSGLMKFIEQIRPGRNRSTGRQASVDCGWKSGATSATHWRWGGECRGAITLFVFYASPTLFLLFSSVLMSPLLCSTPLLWVGFILKISINVHNFQAVIHPHFPFPFTFRSSSTFTAIELDSPVCVYCRRRLLCSLISTTFDYTLSNRPFVVHSIPSFSRSSRLSGAVP